MSQIAISEHFRLRLSHDGLGVIDPCSLKEYEEDDLLIASQDSHLTLKLFIFCHVCFKHAAPYRGRDKKRGPANAARLVAGGGL